MDKLTIIQQKLDSKKSLLRRVRSTLPRLETLISRAENKLYVQWIKPFRYFVNVDDDDRQYNNADQEQGSSSGSSSSSESADGRAP